TSSGYTGVNHAVGPVGRPNGLLKPLPAAIERAMLPVSCSNGAVARAASGIFRAWSQAKANRAPTATTAINKTEVATFLNVTFIAGPSACAHPRCSPHGTATTARP